MYSLSTLVPLTASNCSAEPSTNVEYGTTGKAFEGRLTLYSALSTPAIVLLLAGFPICWFIGRQAFRTVINCSYQFKFVGSFHLIIELVKSIPLLSFKRSVVWTLSNLIKPVAVWLRFGL